MRSDCDLPRWWTVNMVCAPGCAMRKTGARAPVVRRFSTSGLAGAHSGLLGPARIGRRQGQRDESLAQPLDAGILDLEALERRERGFEVSRAGAEPALAGG